MLKFECKISSNLSAKYKIDQNAEIWVKRED